MPKLNQKNKKLVLSFILFLVSVSGLLVANYLVKHETRFNPWASEEATNPVDIKPIIIPGSLLDTGIDPYKFTDVDQTSWSWKYIQQVAPLGIIPLKKSTEFHPQDPVLRYKMAGHLLRTYQIITSKDPPVVETPFTDISHLTQEEQDAIAKIYGLKVTAGTTETTFSPEDPVDRAQMITFFMSLYRAITGEYPPESEVPFTDLEDDPNYQWSIKYIKKAYNLKITAGLTETTFGQAVNTTREQMATFIHSFMRLFGSSYNDQAFKQDLASTKSVVFNLFYPHKLSNYPPSKLQTWLPEIKKAGFNTIYLTTQWLNFDPQPLKSPPQYDQKEIAGLIQTLELFKQNNLKTIIVLNNLTKNEAPDFDRCRWTTNLQMYQAFEDFAKDFLTAIENYADTTYILIATEGSDACLDWKQNGEKIASILRPTLGSLPQRLPKNVRNKFKIGYHDALLSYGPSNDQSPVQMPLSYDFYSFPDYSYEDKTNEQITQAFDYYFNNITKLYPFTPLFMGEFGARYCNYKKTPESDFTNSTNENQARVLKSAISYFLDKNIGFSIWQLQGDFNSQPECPKNSNGTYNVKRHGFVYQDTPYQYPPITINKPARVEIQKLLNPSEPLPVCLESDQELYFRDLDKSDYYQQCQTFHSQCLPDQGTWEQVDTCTCTAEDIWVKNTTTNQCYQQPADCLTSNETPTTGEIHWYGCTEKPSDCATESETINTNELVWYVYDEGMSFPCSSSPIPSNCLSSRDEIAPYCNPDHPNYKPPGYTSPATSNPSPNPSSTPILSPIPISSPATGGLKESNPVSPSDIFPTITDTAQETLPSPSPTPNTQAPVDVPDVNATESTETGIVGFMDKAIDFVLDLFTP